MPSGSQGPTQSVWAGLKSLATLGLKIGGIASLAMTIRKLVSALSEWLRTSMRASMETQLFTRRTGQTQKTLMQWDLAARKAGLAEGEAAQNLEAMVERHNEIMKTGEGVTPFNILGISPNATPSEIFKAFQTETRRRGMDVGQAVSWGKDLGFSKQFSEFLYNFSGALPDIGKMLQTKDELSSVSQLNAAWETLRFTMDQLGRKILSDVAPAITWILDKLTSFAKFFTVDSAARGAGLNFGASVGVGASIPSSLLKAASFYINNNYDTVINAPGQDGSEIGRGFNKAIVKQPSSSVYQRPPQ